MSEEKLYAVKNDKGEYLLIDSSHCWDDKAGTAIKSSVLALDWAKDHGGHVVTLVEEPKKVVLTKEQAKTVKSAHGSKWPALLIDNEASGSKHEEELLMNAYVNGYTVENEKKYNVKVPHTKDVWYFKADESHLLTVCSVDKNFRGKFTESEIKHYGLQDCEKEEVTDDGMGC